MDGRNLFLRTAVFITVLQNSTENEMADNRSTGKKQPGEKREGKFHYNPGNMAGKTAEICQDDPERKSDAEKDRGEHKRDQKQG